MFQRSYTKLGKEIELRKWAAKMASPPTDARGFFFFHDTNDWYIVCAALLSQQLGVTSWRVVDMDASPPPLNVWRYFYNTNRLCIVSSYSCTTYHRLCTNPKSMNGSVKLEGCRNASPSPPSNVGKYFYITNRLCIVFSDLCTTFHLLSQTPSRQMWVLSWKRM